MTKRKSTKRPSLKRRRASVSVSNVPSTASSTVSMGDTYDGSSGGSSHYMLFGFIVFIIIVGVAAWYFNAATHANNYYNDLFGTKSAGNGGLDLGNTTAAPKGYFDDYVNYGKSNPGKTAGAVIGVLLFLGLIGAVVYYFGLGGKTMNLGRQGGSYLLGTGTNVVGRMRSKYTDPSTGNTAAEELANMALAGYGRQKSRLGVYYLHNTTGDRQNSRFTVAEHG